MANPSPAGTGGSIIARSSFGFEIRYCAPSIYTSMSSTSPAPGSSCRYCRARRGEALESPLCGQRLQRIEIAQAWRGQKESVCGGIDADDHFKASRNQMHVGLRFERDIGAARINLHLDWVRSMNWLGCGVRSLNTTGIRAGRAASPRTANQSRKPRAILSPAPSRRSATSELNLAAISSNACPKSRSPSLSPHDGIHARARSRNSFSKSPKRRGSNLGIAISWPPSLTKIKWEYQIANLVSPAHLVFDLDQQYSLGICIFIDRDAQHIDSASHCRSASSTTERILCNVVVSTEAKTSSWMPHPKLGRMTRSPGAVSRMMRIDCRISSSYSAVATRPVADRAEPASPNLCQGNL